jgi:hypothetical protein
MIPHSIMFLRPVYILQAMSVCRSKAKWPETSGQYEGWGCGGLGLYISRAFETNLSLTNKKGHESAEKLWINVGPRSASGDILDFLTAP